METAGLSREVAQQMAYASAKFARELLLLAALDGIELSDEDQRAVARVGEQDRETVHAVVHLLRVARQQR